MELLRLFALIILVGGSMGNLDTKYIASGSSSYLSDAQKKALRESFSYKSEQKSLSFNWKLPEEIENLIYRYKIKYRNLGKNLTCCRVSSGNDMEKTGYSNSYKLEDLEPFSVYTISIRAEEIRNENFNFYIIESITLSTLGFDKLANETLFIKNVHTLKENFIIELENINCSQIFGEIDIVFKIFCEDQQCGQKLIHHYKGHLENSTITMNVHLKPSDHFNYEGWICRNNQCRTIGSNNFPTPIFTDKPPKPNNIYVRWNENNTMTLFWDFNSSKYYENTKFEIMILEEHKWNKTFVFPINPSNFFTTYNFSVSRVFNSTSVIIRITAIYNNVYSETVNYTTSSYPPAPNWMNRNIYYKSDIWTITVELKILRPEYFLSSNFLFFLLNVENPSGQDKKNVEKLEKILQTAFYEDSKTRIVGNVNLSDNNITHLYYQIGNSTFPPILSSKIFNLSQIKFNNKKLKKNHCYNVTILPINEFHGKYRFEKHFFKMCTSMSFRGKMEDWQTPMSIWWISLILLLCVTAAVSFLYKISNSANNKNKLRLSVADDFSTSNIYNHTTSISEKQIEGTMPVATNDYEEIQEDKVEKSMSNEKNFREVETKNFEDYVKRSLKSNELRKQHAMFAKGLIHPCEAGISNENRTKNRYGNLIAYDHSRVKLTLKREIGCSDYINANYINDSNGRKAYIATQGPLSQTIPDFWRMIWQERVKLIVMLANLYEDGKKRVEQYWPDKNEKSIYGNICIRYRSVELFEDYEYRTFSVTCDGEMRQVYQIHFTSWPGHGVPLYSHSLEPIIRKMQEVAPTFDSPIVVHCSAGVGRTGIILLCYICMRMAQEKGVVDMVHTLYRLREQRPNMVDNYEQYKLAHLVVLDCLTTLNTDIECDDGFKHSVDRLIHNKKDKMEATYLKENQWRDEAMKSVAKGDGETIRLSKYPNNDESSTHIKAVWVQGYRSPEKFIVTQQPKPNTLPEFWRLIVEKHVTVVVSLNKINFMNEDIGIFWPNEDQPNISPLDFLSVVFENVVHSPYYDMYSVIVFLKEEQKEIRVKIYSLKNWEASVHLPPSCEEFISFLSTVEAVSDESRHILVTCLDGVTASGMYVALSHLIQRMKMEKVCDVLISVRTIRHNREEFIVNDIQYSFLYSAALCWMEKHAGSQS